MINLKLNLKSHESHAVELTADNALKCLTARAVGGRTTVDIQASTDGLTFGSPVAHLRLDSKFTSAVFALPEQTRKVRLNVCNHAGVGSFVVIEDSPVSEVAEPEDATL